VKSDVVFNMSFLYNAEHQSHHCLFHNVITNSGMPGCTMSKKFNEVVVNLIRKKLKFKLNRTRRRGMCAYT
jgi:hypothetical protein